MRSVLLLFCFFVLGSCAWRPGPIKNEALVVVPQNFLNTKDPSTLKWLDTPQRVTLEEKKIQDVFKNPLFTDLYYELRDFPHYEEKPVRIQNSSITRRQVLWILAQDYHLHMRFDYDENALPYKLKIKYMGQDKLFSPVSFSP